MYKLLIVDDEVHILEGMKHIIDWERYNISTIYTENTFQGALMTAAAKQPEIGLFDVRIGNDKGYQLIEEIHGLGIPIFAIVMSGYEEFEYVQESLRQGAKDYLLKPVDRQRLEEVVEQIVVKELGGSIVNPPPDLEDIDPVTGKRYSEISQLGHRIVQMIHAGYSGDISLRSVGEVFQMNSTYLGQIFIQEMDMKFSEYLMAYRLQVAAEKIRTSNEKISTIAAEVGYNNMNYFYTHFRNYYNCSPTEMRKKEYEGS